MGIHCRFVVLACTAITGFTRGGIADGLRAKERPARADTRQSDLCAINGESSLVAMNKKCDDCDVLVGGVQEMLAVWQPMAC